MANPYAGLSALAQKYGYPPDNEMTLLREMKSGLTPIVPDSIVKRGPNDDYYEELQRLFYLNGFRARELRDYGCYPDSNAQLHKLTNEIHECLRIDKWESSLQPIPNKTILPIVAQGPEYSLGNNPGLWCASNPLIWELLDPVLTLVSRFLEDIHTNEFYDAFLCGQPMKQLPTPPGARSQYEFRTQDPATRDYRKNRETLRKLFSEKCVLRLSFGEPGNIIANPKMNKPGMNGITNTADGNDPNSPTNVYLSINQWKSLLRNDLNPSERMCNQFICALTLLHELAHVMQSAYAGWSAIFFFQDQLFSEMGFAASMSIFGGNTQEFTNMGRSTGPMKMNDDSGHSFPALGCWLLSHPSGGAANRSNNIAYRRMPKMPTTTTFRPVPSLYFEYTHQDEFWDVGVKSWGLSAVAPLTDWAAKRLADMSKYNKFWKISKELQDLKAPRPVADHQGSTWYEDRGPPTSLKFFVEQFMTMSTTDRQAVALTRTTREKDDRVKQRARFNNGRTTFLSSFRTIKEDLAKSKADGNRVQWIDGIRALTTLMRRECRRQWRTIARFMLSKESDPQQKQFLAELNHYMRNMVKQFEIEIAGFFDSEAVDAAAEMMEMVDTSLVMLNDQNPTGVSSEDYYLQSKRQVTPALILDLRTNGYQAFAARLDGSYIPGLLDQGKAAVAAKDANLCSILGNRLIDNFSDLPFCRAVGKILLLHDGTLPSRLVCKILPTEEEEALTKWANVSVEMRAEWTAIRDNRLIELAEDDIRAYEVRKQLQSTPPQTYAQQQAAARKVLAAAIARQEAEQRFMEADGEAAEEDARLEGADEAEVAARKAAAVQRGIVARQNIEALLEGEERQIQAAKLLADAEVQLQQQNPPQTPPSEPGDWCPFNVQDDGGWSESQFNIWLQKQYLSPPQTPTRTTKMCHWNRGNIWYRGELEQMEWMYEI